MLGLATLVAVTGCTATASPTAPSSPTPSATATPWTPTGVVASLSGAGPAPLAGIVDMWRTGMATGNPDVSLAYDATESPVSRLRFAAGTDQFAVSSRAFTEAERQELDFAGCASPETATASPSPEKVHPTIVQLPVSVTSIAVVFRLDGVTSLNLDAATLAGIYAGRIQTWNDPAIAASNPSLELPDTPITAVHVGQASGLTQNFTDYLSANTDSVWTSGSVERWPLRSGLAAPTASDVSATVAAHDGAIGYTWTADAGDADIARIASYSGYAPPSATGALATVGNSEQRTDALGTTLTVVVDRSPSVEGAYPLVAVDYLIGCAEYPDAAATAGFRALALAATAARVPADAIHTGLPASVRAPVRELLTALPGPGL